MPICLCMNWCSTARISSFFVQLPTITDTSSPWLPYLAAVYNEPTSLPLPINLQQLGLVALPSSRRGAARAGIPFETECAEPQQRCPCESALWLNESAVPLDTAALPQVSAQHNRSQRALPWSWRPGGRTAREKRETVTDVRLLTMADGLSVNFLFLSPLIAMHRSLSWGQKQQSQPVANGTWLEVLRDANHVEGMGAGAVPGCWFCNTYLHLSHPSSQSP